MVFRALLGESAVYPDGRVCISILHSPVADEMSGELPQERWLPTQNPTTVMLSVISMLNDPNFSSPANVDASVRRRVCCCRLSARRVIVAAARLLQVECRKETDAYRRRIRRLVEKANREVPPRIKIPHPDTDPEERRRALDRMKQHQLAGTEHPHDSLPSLFLSLTRTCFLYRCSFICLVSPVSVWVLV